MNTLYAELPLEEQNEDEQVLTIGDEIANQFYYGNFSFGIERLQELSISSDEFIEFLEETADSYDCKLIDLYGGHFSPSFFVALGCSR